ncbi:MAG: PASTA domain-containing protein [Sphingobacteriales bacterium]|nr:MAG: PASTA domain-containing protein [Sphingobacteriales bacterium]
MKIIDQIKSRNFLLNIAILALAVIFLFVILTWFLKWYTHHGESLTVPDFKGRTVEEVEQICDEKDLRFEIKDSVFAPDKPKLSVVEQNPKPGSKVKRNRRIYILINTDKAPKVALPELKNVQLRQAERILESYGLKRGSISYKPDIALNAVMPQDGMLVNGQPVEAGTMLDKGTVVDLVLGDGGQNKSIEIPNLTGNTLDEALFVLRGNSLNIGAVVIDAGVKDSTKAIIYKQRPLSGEGKTISQGSAIDVWLKEK